MTTKTINFMPGVTETVNFSVVEGTYVVMEFVGDTNENITDAAISLVAGIENDFSHLVVSEYENGPTYVWSCKTETDASEVLDILLGAVKDGKNAVYDNESCPYEKPRPTVVLCDSCATRHEDSTHLVWVESSSATCTACGK